MGKNIGNQTFVFGRVTDKLNRPLPNLFVQAFDKDMRSEELLGESCTDRDGKYKIYCLHGRDTTSRVKDIMDIAIKVLSPGKKILLYSSTMEEIRFNASSREEINITISSAIKPDMVEYDYILGKVTYLADKIAISDIQESTGQRDVTFLSKETGISAEKIEHLVVAQRLSIESKIDAAFFYAILRKNTLLKNNFNKSFRARLIIDINSDTLKILYDAVLADQKTIQKDVVVAAKEMIISMETARKLQRYMDMLQQYKSKAEEYYRNEHPKRVLNTISRFVLEDKINEMGKLFEENKNDLNTFLNKITDDSFFSNETTATQAKTTIAIGELLGFDDTIISQVRESQEINNINEVRKLARLNKAGWKEELVKASSKITASGKTIDKELIDLQASSLVRKMEAKFPTTAFAAQLERESKPVFKNQDDIKSFLSKHDDFDLQKSNIDLFFKEKPVDAKQSDAIRQELKSVQRIFKLAPVYSKTNALLAQNIHSSQSIVAVGESRFIKEIAPKAGINTKEAKAIFRKAEKTNIAAMLIAGELQDTIRAINIPAMEMATLSKKLVKLSEDFPNLETLFNMSDVCVCEHCRSVYSPAAYLVEILQFLDNRRVTDITSATPSIGNAKDRLFERRPDIAEIDLGCENANTPVPYIDLVCELLEEAAVPTAGISFTGDILDDPSQNTGKISTQLLNALTTLLPEYQKIPITDKAMLYRTESLASTSEILPYYLRDTKAVCKVINNGGNNWTIRRLHQTLSSEEELAAAPEYVNQGVYRLLSDELALSDPSKRCDFAFRLPFDLNHTEAKAYFNRFDISRSDLMTDFQTAAVVPSDEAITAEKLGLTNAERNLIVTPEPNQASQQLIWNATLDYMKRLDHFLDKTGLTYKETDLLLSLKFIDPAISHTDELYIRHLDLSCDTAEKEIANLDVAALDRIHRFLRLQKKTGWKLGVLDEIISQSQLGKGILDNACLIKAADLLTISRETGIKLEELICFYGEIPLYSQVFLNKAKNGFIDERLLPEVSNWVGIKLSELRTSLSVCLQLSEQDFDKLLPLLPDDNLTIVNLSYFLAISRLMKKLKLKSSDLLILQKLTGINISGSPEETLQFIEAYKDFKGLPLKAADVIFMLNHEGENLADRVIKDDKIIQVLEKLQKDYQNSFVANKSLYNKNLSVNEQRQTLQTALSKLGGIEETDVKTFIRIIERDWTLGIDAKDIVTNKLSAVLSPSNTLSVNSKIDALETASEPDFEPEKTDLAETLITSLDPAADLTGLSLSEEIILIQNILSQLSGITEDDISVLVKFIEFDRISATYAKDSMVRDKLEFADKANNIVRPGFDGTLIKSRIDALWIAPALTANDKRKELLEAFFDSIGASQFQSDKQSLLEQSLVSTFKADAVSIKVILASAILKQTAPGNELVGTLLQTDELIDKTNATPVLPAITEANFPKQFHSIRLLHKLIPLINFFNLTNPDIDWYFRNNAKAGWFELDSIPYETGHTAIVYSKFAGFAKFIGLSKQLTAVPDPADAENPVTFFTIADMLLPASGATRHQFLEALSLLTGYDKDDIDALDVYFKFSVQPEPVGLDAYCNPVTWGTIMKSAEYLRKTGLKVNQIKEFLKPSLTAGDANQLRTALKARYDEDTWLSTLREITDVIRPQKRDALVAYLLAVNPDMKDENDLYDYFLIDVEMESGMPSSRIVQAHGTVQLFVQRCLMGLEPKAAADVATDKNWEQWKWMKNYRVWEANRKIFLYPENWIEAELRDHKSFQFTELENELLQNELTEFTAEDALVKYLEKLDDIAFLEIMATWYQSDIKTMHVFARTKGGDPGIYYYRRFEEERYWTPWEKVELDITGDHLLAYVRNNRLCLAWPVFTEIPDPDQEATVPAADAGSVPVDKPKKKLKIQLAVSEFANKKWQTKKISRDGILTPVYEYTNEEEKLRRDKYNLMYFELAQQICIFTTQSNGLNEYHQVDGVFNIAGSKGYPELALGYSPVIVDFLPDFKDTRLSSQRYNELNMVPGDDLSVKNGVSFYNYYKILDRTPGNFRLSYPHQLTWIDMVSWLIQYFLMISYRKSLTNSTNSTSARHRSLKLPLGTLLPYFMEDSNHAYVIMPGFYEKGEAQEDTTVVKRTGSDILQLIEDIFALYQTYIAIYKNDPSHDVDALTEALIKDDDYQKIVKELRIYANLSYGEQFRNMYHPLICSLKKTYYKDGISELMKRETQLQKTNFNFENCYGPDTAIVPKTYPLEDIDFTSDGSYSCYNWELFFHIPFLLATRLTKNQRFEEALTWFHYMFNPTGALEGTVPQKYWVTKPFYLANDSDYLSQRIDNLMKNVANPDSPDIAELEFAIDQWRKKPFKPHVVARFRPVAYQKALLMKYIDNLTEWGDYLFRQDTMESIVQATQMYILADKLLGPKPRAIPPVVKVPYETYNQIEAKIDSFGNALVDLENILPDLSVLPEGGEELPSAPPITTLSMLYFCIPQNDKMMEYWDRIADRLFKIRNCQNIDGVERSLALFAPPIDPGMLARAAAAGLDISAVLAGMNAPLPYYRFNVLSQKATELANEVRTLGNSLLDVLEKKDAEAMSLLRSKMEIKVLNAVRDIRKLQVKESKEQIEVLKRTKKVTEERKKYFSQIEKINKNEQLYLDKMGQSNDYNAAAQGVKLAASIISLIPDIDLGASGFGGSPITKAKFGGLNIGQATNAASDILSYLGMLASNEASRASLLGGYDRRYDDWKLQERLANLELGYMDKQIAAAEIRKEMAETDLKNHDLLIENVKKEDEFMRSKFTNEELYIWMMRQISLVYFSSYQLAHDFAKKAERCYRFELGNDDSFISYGYWDSMKKGLQSADHLIHDIKRMETSYLDKNKREYEITKQVSLVMLDPLALVRLRRTGVCDFDIPEVLYDMDHAGHYFRRIKSVSISLHCTAGAYTSVSARLSLVKNKYRKNTNPDNMATTGYMEDPGNDERFVYNVGAIQSIATSSPINDSGVFELNFRDERYLPFEGTGAISSWRLELPTEVMQFDYNTITDLIIHVKYTAREGGSGLKTEANKIMRDLLSTVKQGLNQNGLHIAINVKNEMPDNWHVLKTDGLVDLVIDKSGLPYMVQPFDTAIENVMFIAKVKGNPASFTIYIDDNAADLSRIDDLKLCRGINKEIALDTPFTLSVSDDDKSELEELVMIVKYVF